MGMARTEFLQLFVQTSQVVLSLLVLSDQSLLFDQQFRALFLQLLAHDLLVFQPCNHKIMRISVLVFRMLREKFFLWNQWQRGVLVSITRVSFRGIANESRSRSPYGKSLHALISPRRWRCS
jgi:hypothetical protein